MSRKFWLIKWISPYLYESIAINLGITSYRLLGLHLWEMLTFDFRYNVNTRKIISAKNLNFSDKEAQTHAVRYRPSPVICVRRSLQLLKTYMPNYQDVSFVDYGSGMGRVMIIAAETGFKKVIGLELSHDLNIICQSNIEQYKKHVPKSDFLIINKDARLYTPPADACVFFFFKPFDEWVHKQVMKQISESLNSNPRTIFCLTLQANYDFSDFGIQRIAKETGVTIYSNKEVASSG